MNTTIITIILLFPIFKKNPRAVGPGNPGYDIRSEESSDRRRREDELHILPYFPPAKEKPT